MRTVRMPSADGEPVLGWVRIGQAPQENALAVAVSETLLPVLPRVLERLRHLFDLLCDPDEVYAALQTMNEVRSGLCASGTRLPGCFDAFEMAIRAVLGQQITVKAASTLAARMVETYGMPLQTGIEGLTHVFPTPEDILDLGESIEDCLGPIGVIGSRAKTIHALAQALSDRSISLEYASQPAKEIEKLMAIRGIGSWTAHYVAMRAMGWTDAFLETDAGIKKALPNRTAKELLEIAEAWRPWRSYATITLWNSLQENRK
jgi:AraC family transcriptional regulator of adaptative response / DNA-3-methyladenine glycosylase II